MRRLGRDVLAPDLAGWRRERLPVLPDEPLFTLAVVRMVAGVEMLSHT
jgi:hypothetical protein